MKGANGYAAGSIPNKVIARLAKLPADEWLHSEQLAGAVGIDMPTLIGCTKRPRKRGQVETRLCGIGSRSGMLWRLGSKLRDDPDAEPPPEPDPLPARRTIVPAAERAGDVPRPDEVLQAMQRMARVQIEGTDEEEPEGLAGAARGPETAKETTNGRGLGEASGDDAKRDGGPASPRGHDADDFEIALTVRCYTLHEVERIQQFVRGMRQGVA